MLNLLNEGLQLLTVLFDSMD